MVRRVVLLALLSTGSARADADHTNDRHPLTTPRAAVAWTGFASLVGGVAWFFAAGDSLGAGDPAGVMVAGGGIALAGAAIGRAVDGRWARGTPDPHSAGTPAAELGLTPGGTTTLGERDPWSLDAGVAPRLQGDGLQVILAAAGGSQLRRAVAVDPRPEAAGQVALQTHRWGYDVEPEVRFQRPQVDLQLLPMMWTGVEAVTTTDDVTRTVHREAVVGAVGVRLHVTARQRFLVAVGPRFDALRFSLDDDTFSRRTWTPGPVYGGAAWQFDLPGPRHIGPWASSSRLTLGYEHENFHGTGFDFAAVNGFFGPIRASWDLRVRPGDGPHALQATVDATLGTGGGLRFALGWAPPVRPLRPASP